MTLNRFVVLGTLLGVMATVPAQAQLLKIKNRVYKFDGATAPDEVQASLDEMFDAFETQINDQFNQLGEVEPTDYLKGVGNATSLAMSGLSSDYSTDFSLVSVGVGLGVGADLGDGSISDAFKGNIDSLKGFGASAGVVIGVSFEKLLSKKLGPIDLGKLRAFLSFMSFDRDFGDASVGMSSFGLHAIYKLIDTKGIGAGLLRWTGVSVGAGYQHSSMKLAFSKDLENLPSESVVLDAPYSTTATIAMEDGKATISADASINKIPLEISTGARMLYIFDVYGGLGLDFNFGSASADASVNSDLNITDTGNHLNGTSADVDFGLNDKIGPSAMSMRYFAGVGFNMALAELYAQWNSTLSGSKVGATIGMRAYW